MTLKTDQIDSIDENIWKRQLILLFFAIFHFYMSINVHSRYTHDRSIALLVEIDQVLACCAPKRKDTSMVISPLIMLGIISYTLLIIFTSTKISFHSDEL